MDSITQAALGAAIGHTVLGHRVGRKALLWGAMLGTVPDLDTFYPYGDPVDAFTSHRGYSHSYFILALAAPCIAWIAVRLHGRAHWRHWLLLCLLCLLTHPLLDSFTVYGTQVGLPFTNYPVAWSTIFIIDPLFTLPLLLGITTALLWPRESSPRWNPCAVGLGLSCAYLGITLAAKAHLDQVARQAVHALNASDTTNVRYMTTPAPFNVLLWRVVVMGPHHYWEGFYSIIAGRRLTLAQHPNGHALLNPVASRAPAIPQLAWFSRGFYAAHERPDGTIRIQDLRMGFLGRYVFTFDVARRAGNDLVPLVPAEKGSPVRPSQALLSAVAKRIVSPDALDPHIEALRPLRLCTARREPTGNLPDIIDNCD